MKKIIKKINDIFAKRVRKTVEPDLVFNKDRYDEIQAFVYRDLDMLKKTKYQAYLNNLPQPLSEEAKRKIELNKIELSKTLDKMIRDKQSSIYDMKKKFGESSPIPRHPSTPESTPDSSTNE